MGHHRIISNLQSPTKDLLIIDFYVNFVLKYQLARQGNNPKINFACMLSLRHNPVCYSALHNLHDTKDKFIW